MSSMAMKPALLSETSASNMTCEQGRIARERETEIDRGTETERERDRETEREREREREMWLELKTLGDWVDTI